MTQSFDSRFRHVGLIWHIREGKVAEYDARHASMWPELEARLRELGLVDCTIFRRGRECFGHFQIRGDWETYVQRSERDPLGLRWEEEFADLIEPHPEVPDGGSGVLHHVWSLGTAL